MSRPRAFNLLELAISLLIFSMVATALTIAVTRSVTAQVDTRAARTVSEALDADLTTLAGTGYDALAQGTFTVPDPCPGQASTTGPDARTCLRIGQSVYTVAWTLTVSAVSTTAAPAGTAALTPAAVHLTGTVAVAGQTLTGTRTVTAPALTAASGGDGTIHLTLTGSYAHLAGPVYLLSAADPTSVVASAQATDGVAVLTAPAAACTSAAPCTLGLSASTHPDSYGGYAIARTDLTGPGTSIGTGTGTGTDEIVLTSGAQVQASLAIVRTGTASISLLATDSTGRTRTGAHAGSVCLWGTFTDAGARRSVPFCNTGADPATITVTDYPTHPLDPTSPGPWHPLPVGVPITLTEDDPAGTCPKVAGSVGAVTDSTGTAVWSTDVAVCTSWTWGTPSTFGPAGSATAWSGSATITLDPTTAGAYQLIWQASSAPAHPAAQGLFTWTYPREAAGCAYDASCAPLPAGTVPETTDCTGTSMCLSVIPDAAPQLTDPCTTNTTTYVKVCTVRAAGSSTPFTLTPVSPDGGTVTVTIVSTPGTAVSYNGTAVTAGQVIGPVASGTHLAFAYAGTAPHPASALTVKLTGAGGHAASTTIGFWNGTQNQGWVTVPQAAAAAQGQSGVRLAAVVYDINGNPYTNGGVTFAAPAGVTLSAASVNTDSSGTAAVTAAFPTAPAGTDTVIVTDTTSGHTAALPVTVSATAAGVSVGATSVAQGGTGTITATVTDAAGAGMGGVQVNLVVLSGSTAATHVYPKYVGCLTASSGSCTVQVLATTAATAGAYTVRGSVGTLAASSPLTVTPVAAGVNLGSLTLAEGASAAVTGQVTDTAGNPYGGAVTLTLAGGTGLSVSPTQVTSDATGAFTVTVAAAAAAPAGSGTLTATVAGHTCTVPVLVTGSAGALSVTGPTIAEGGTGTVLVSVTDGAGNPLSGVQATFAGPADGSHITVTSRATATSGQVAAPVSVPLTAAPGVHHATVRVGTVTADVPITVTAAPAQVVVEGAPAAGSTGPVTFVVTDGVGAPVAGATISVNAAASGLVLTPSSGTTDSSGALPVTVDATGASAQVWQVPVTVNGTTLTATLVIR